MRRLVVWLLIPAVAVAGFWYLRHAPPAPPSLPGWATAPPGTELPDGFKVPAGALQLGPVLHSKPEGGRDEWKTILAVTGDPLEVWEEYLGQLARRYPAEPIEPDTRQGCRAGKRESFGCEIRVSSVEPGGTVVAGATLLNPSKDVTGRYLVVVESTRYPEGFGDLYAGLPKAWEGDKAPDPLPARKAPKAGEPLAPSTTAYEGDDERYVVIMGSEMLAQWGSGSVTGGFDVLLAVSPGAVTEQVGEAYARQAAQYEGETQVERYTVVNTEYTHFVPPGGVGGYQAEIWAVDPPGDSGFIFYSLFND